MRRDKDAVQKSKMINHPTGVFMRSPFFFAAAFLGICVLSGTGCSTAKVRVMPGEGGVNHVVARDIEKDGAETAAVDAATEYCKNKKMTAVFVNDKTKYTGDMDESTRNTVRKASKAAMILGGTGFGASSDTRPAGAILGSAGTAGHVMTSDRDYESSVEFKCQ